MKLRVVRKNGQEELIKDASVIKIELDEPYNTYIGIDEYEYSGESELNMWAGGDDYMIAVSPVATEQGEVFKLELIKRKL